MRLSITVILLALPGSAYAQTPPLDLKGSRINLDTRAFEEVDNDVMRATLFVEMEDVDAAKLDLEAGSSRITVTVNGAILIPR